MTGSSLWGGIVPYYQHGYGPPQVAVVPAGRRAVRSQEHPPIARVVVSRRITTPPPDYLRSTHWLIVVILLQALQGQLP